MLNLMWKQGSETSGFFLPDRRKTWLISSPVRNPAKKNFGRAKNNKRTSRPLVTFRSEPTREVMNFYSLFLISQDNKQTLRERFPKIRFRMMYCRIVEYLLQPLHNSFPSARSDSQMKLQRILCQKLLAPDVCTYVFLREFLLVSYY